MLKRYHPVAHIVNNNKQITGMMICSGSKPAKGETSTLVNMQQFNQLVANNEIQLFKMGDNGPIVAYTDEEVKKLLKKGKIRQYNTEEYFKNDARFNEEDMRGTTHIAVSIAAVKVCKGIFMSYGAIHRNQPFTASEINQIRKISNAVMLRVTDDLYIFSAYPTQLFQALKLASYNQGIGANYDTAFTFDNALYNKKLIFFKNLDGRELQYCINKWNYMIYMQK